MFNIAVCASIIAKAESFAALIRRVIESVIIPVVSAIAAAHSLFCTIANAATSIPASRASLYSISWAIRNENNSAALVKPSNFKVRTVKSFANSTIAFFTSSEASIIMPNASDIPIKAANVEAP